MKLTDEQASAVDAFADLANGRRQRLVLGGGAGTGKSTVVAEIVREYGGRCNLAVCAPTGKAAHVLRTKGIDEAGTLHSLIYVPQTRRDGSVDFVFNDFYFGSDSIAIVDEASMLSQRLVSDLQAKISRVLYVGDHGQLEPVGDDPGLMKSPDIILREVHRQAAQSPVIRFAYAMRKGWVPRVNTRAAVQDAAVRADEALAAGALAELSEDEQAAAVRALARLQSGNVDGAEALGELLRIGGMQQAVRVQRGWSRGLAGADVILCGYNKTRQKVNAVVRQIRGFDNPLPQVGESVICLRNDANRRVWNGMTGTITAISIERERMSVRTDDGLRSGVKFDLRQFGALKPLPYERPRRGQEPKTLWDWGYCLTVHKAQGSEWDHVAVVEELSPKWSAERWRYTAATRASKRLTWVFK